MLFELNDTNPPPPPLRLARAITIHKSQGLTFVEMDCKNATRSNRGCSWKSDVHGWP